MEITGAPVVVTGAGSGLVEATARHLATLCARVTLVDRNASSATAVVTFNMMRLAAARMQGNAPVAAGERGAIINSASLAAFDGQMGQTAHAASKGIVVLALPAARNLAGSGIRVSTVAPGLFRRPLMAELPDDAQAGLAAAIPFPRAAWATSARGDRRPVQSEIGGAEAVQANQNAGGVSKSCWREGVAGVRGAA